MRQFDQKHLQNNFQCQLILLLNGQLLQQIKYYKLKHKLEATPTKLLYILKAKLAKNGGY